MTKSVFAPDALDANRAGALSARQRSELSELLDRNSWRIVRPALRRLDPLAKDLRSGRVESIEGAITKKPGSTWDQALTAALTNIPVTSAPATHISVANREQGDQQFISSPWIDEFAPDAGMVRLFYLPESRRAVNLELLPDAVADASPEGMQQALAEFTAAGDDKVAAAEARARMAAIEHELKSYLPNPASLAAETADPGPLAEAILGDWTNPFLDLSIRDGGTLVTRLTDGSRSEGHWSLDAGGRLHADLMGAAMSAEVSVYGDELTLVMNDQAVKLRRAVSG